VPVPRRAVERRGGFSLPTGKASGFVVLDIDVKDPRAYGFDTLDQLGFAILPVTRMVHTGSGGLHLHFDPGEQEIRNTAGKKGRGIGPGCDWRGTGGYVIMPSNGSGYSWDPIYGLDTPLAAVPPELLPREPERIAAKPVERADGLSPYAEAAVVSACNNIARAPNTEQEATLHGECCSRRHSASPVTIRRNHGEPRISQPRSTAPSMPACASRGRCAAMAEGNGTDAGRTGGKTGNGTGKHPNGSGNGYPGIEPRASSAAVAENLAEPLSITSRVRPVADCSARDFSWCLCYKRGATGVVSTGPHP
jgi:hypothetical protein